MLVTRKSRRAVRLQNYTFLVLFLGIIGLLGWLSTRYHFQSDWTSSGRNTLSEASIGLLKQIKGPVTITVFAREAGMARKQISEVINRYQRHKPDLKLTFINPDTDPEATREYGITMDGELVVEYQNRKENLRDLNEESITNALQRIARSGERWIVFLEGHGERNPQGQANHDFRVWVEQLKTKGFQSKALNLAVDNEIPDNTSVLVLADPRVALLPPEVDAIKAYLDKGGNLLWFQEPGTNNGLESIAEKLGITFQAGVIVDPTSKLIQIDNPAIAVGASYGLHPVTKDFNMITLFPISGGITAAEQGEWESAALVKTANRSWAETGELRGEISYDAGADIAGPLNIAMALTRQVKQDESQAQKKDEQANTQTEQSNNQREQRVVVLGDADFLSNSFLGNLGNMDFGMNMINWLSADDDFVAIPAKPVKDTSLSLSRTQSLSIASIFLLVLPLVLLITGMAIWFRRRKR